MAPRPQEVIAYLRRFSFGEWREWKLASTDPEKSQCRIPSAQNSVLGTGPLQVTQSSSHTVKEGMG